MQSSVPVAYTDELLDLRNGWIGVGWQTDSALAATRYHGDGSVISHLRVGVEECSKVVAAWMALMERRYGRTIVEKKFLEHLGRARLGVDLRENMDGVRDRSADAAGMRQPASDAGGSGSDRGDRG